MIWFGVFGKRTMAARIGRPHSAWAAPPDDPDDDAQRHDPPEDGRQVYERNEQVQRVRWIQVVDLRLDLIRATQLGRRVVHACVQPTPRDELVVGEVVADRVLRIDDAEQDDEFDRAEREEDDGQTDQERAQASAGHAQRL